MPDDAERDGSSFTEKITALWPPRRQRTGLPSLERSTVKAHVLAHVARSRGGPRTPASADSHPRLAHPSAVRIGPRAPLEHDERDLPRPPPPFPRGSQTTPRIDEDPGPPPGLLAAQPAPEAPPPAAVVASASAAAMPPLYAGIVPYRHTLRPGVFELTAAPLAAPVAPAVPRRRPAASRVHPVAWAMMLLVSMWWSAAYWQVWHALSLTQRLGVVWRLLSGLLGG